MRYDERASQTKKSLDAKSVGKVLGSTKKQDNTAKRPFAVFDIDGTLIRWQLYHAIVDTLGRHGHIEPDVYRSLKAARRAWKLRAAPNSFSAYELQLVKAFKELLERLSITQFDRAVEEVYEQYKDQVYTYTRDLLKKLKAQGYTLLAISASQSEIVGKVAKHHGFDDYIGAEQERVGRRFTGSQKRVFDQKHFILQKLIETHDLTTHGSIGVGDSESDISMLELVEQPIAFNPTHKLFEHAKQNNWKIVIERKNMVYQLEPGDDHYVLV